MTKGGQSTRGPDLEPLRGGQCHPNSSSDCWSAVDRLCLFGLLQQEVLCMPEVRCTRLDSEQ